MNSALNQIHAVSLFLQLVEAKARLIIGYHHDKKKKVIIGEAIFASPNLAAAGIDPRFDLRSMHCNSIRSSDYTLRSHFLQHLYRKMLGA